MYRLAKWQLTKCPRFLSKIFEFIIPDRIKSYIQTCDNQFGFKKEHGADSCIYIMKEVINRYQVLGNTVHLCFLDASKAFDHVNHLMLIKKRVTRKVPGCRLLAFLVVIRKFL